MANSRDLMRQSRRDAVVRAMSDVKGQWLSALEVAELAGLTRHETAEALRVLCETGNDIVRRLEKVETQGTRPYEFRYRYCFLFRQVIGNRWLYILGEVTNPIELEEA